MVEIMYQVPLTPKVSINIVAENPRVNPFNIGKKGHSMASGGRKGTIKVMRSIAIHVLKLFQNVEIKLCPVLPETSP